MDAFENLAKQAQDAVKTATGQAKAAVSGVKNTVDNAHKETHAALTNAATKALIYQIVLEGSPGMPTMY